MKTLILFYSHSGKTEALAGKKAAELKDAGFEVDVERVVEIKKPSVAIGTLRALRRTKTAIEPIKAKLGDYDKIVIMSPVWAGHPVSAINSVIELLPAGKAVELIMTSAGGGTKKSALGTKSLVVARGCEVVSYEDVKVSTDGDEVIVTAL
jgi:hypothetical protein